MQFLIDKHTRQIGSELLKQGKKAEIMLSIRPSGWVR